MAIDLNNFKEQIQSILDAANTLTAQQDLSSGLADRVQKVLKVNPARIPIQASFYPCVTCYIDRKVVQNDGIAKDQLTAKRRARVTLKIVGAVWNSTISADDEDPADEDCESLMENIEQILRANPTIAGVATWSFPTDVTYHNVAIEEDTHLRAGILSLEASIFY